MGIFKRIIKLMKNRNEIFKGIKTKLKRIDKSLNLIAKEIGDLSYEIEQLRRGRK